MDDAEAVKLTSLIADLWPHPPMSDVRKAFYAKALATAIPTYELGLRAVDALFVSERYAPTPGDVIDRVLGVGVLVEVEWGQLIGMAGAIQTGTPLSETIDLAPEALALFRSVVPRGFRGLPLKDHVQQNRYHNEYLKRRGEELRLASTGRLSLAEG